MMNDWIIIRYYKKLRFEFFNMLISMGEVEFSGSSTISNNE